SNGVPSACTLLTASLVRKAIGEKPTAPKPVPENPELNACQYRSVNQTFGHTRRVQLTVGSADEIKSLSSSAQPAMSGLGDEAHGGDANIGLAALKGKLGLEVVVDLDDPAHPERSLAAERRLATALLARLQ